MFEGLWIVQYAGMEGKDAGVVVLTQGKVLGGDNAFTYIGTYEEFKTGFDADILVENFNPSIGNVLGVKGNFTLNLKVSTVDDDSYKGKDRQSSGAWIRA